MMLLWLYNRDVGTLGLYVQLHRAAFASLYYFLFMQANCLVPLSHSKTIFLILIYIWKEEEHFTRKVGNNSAKYFCFSEVNMSILKQLSEACSVLLPKNKLHWTWGGILKRAGCWSNSVVTEGKTTDFSNSRLMSMLALFEENKENSRPPKLPVGFKDRTERPMPHRVTVDL